MRIQRFFVNPEQTDLDGPVATLCEPGLINQVRNVLRLRPQDKILLLDGRGNLYNCRLTSIAKQSLQAEIVSKEQATGEAAVRVCIALPLIKGGRFEWALEKMTELGVAAVIPVVPQRAVVKMPGLSSSGKKDSADSIERKLRHWQGILKEAAEQCERACIPDISPPLELKELLSGAALPKNLGIENKLICTERRKAPNMGAVAHTLDIPAVPPPGVCVVIGPEGGLTDEEVAVAEANGWQAVSLGTRILRSETAAIYALAQIISVADN